MKAGLRDSTFYSHPAHDTGRSKYHAIVPRDPARGAGPACGYPFHDETTEVEAATVPDMQRCNRPGCKSAFAQPTSHGAGVSQ